MDVLVDCERVFQAGVVLEDGIAARDEIIRHDDGLTRHSWHTRCCGSEAELRAQRSSFLDKVALAKDMN